MRLFREHKSFFSLQNNTTYIKITYFSNWDNHLLQDMCHICVHQLIKQSMFGCIPPELLLSYIFKPMLTQSQSNAHSCTMKKAAKNLRIYHCNFISEVGAFVYLYNV